MRSRTWLFPSGTTWVQVAYDAARRKIEHEDAHTCAMNIGMLHDQSILIFRWHPDVDKRLPAIIDAIALLVGGSALIQEEAEEGIWHMLTTSGETRAERA